MISAISAWLYPSASNMVTATRCRSDNSDRASDKRCRSRDRSVSRSGPGARSSRVSGRAPVQIRGCVDRDAHQPGAERPTGVESVQVPPRQKERILGGIVRIEAIFQNGTGHSPDNPGIPIDQGPKGHLVAARGSRYQPALSGIQRTGDGLLLVGHQLNPGAGGGRCQCESGHMNSYGSAGENVEDSRGDGRGPGWGTPADSRPFIKLYRTTRSPGGFW